MEPSGSGFMLASFGNSRSVIKVIHYIRSLNLCLNGASGLNGIKYLLVSVLRYG